MTHKADFHPLHPAERIRCAEERVEIMTRLGMTEYELRCELRRRREHRTSIAILCGLVTIFVAVVFWRLT